ncbi:MAG: glycine--tRNA ligase [Acidobacteriota bacterium]
MSRPEGTELMEKIVALCKRRGFIFPASEIYGGLNGFWDYGPLGAQLKNNLRDAWWRDMVECPPIGPDGHPVSIVGLDSSIIQNPRAWEASGHVGGFSDPMVDCRETKARYRADHLQVLVGGEGGPYFAFVEGEPDPALKRAKKVLKRKVDLSEFEVESLLSLGDEQRAAAWAPGASEPGTLTEPRDFNLMFRTFIGATGGDENVAYLRPETAQGIFLNYRGVLDTSRVRVPFGIAQVGKAFRNEVTPRNYIFRSREFEQMEMEWFCAPEEAEQWFDFWTQTRLDWWKSVGASEENLVLRKHDADELAHYAKEGLGTYDVEYKYPFTAPGFGELEGIAHRGDFDLSQHQEWSGKKLEYFDPQTQQRFMPHVIEPASGLTRGVLVLLCEAYDVDESRPSPEIMRFDPRLAPIKVGVFPLVNKDGMPEIAEKLYLDLRTRWVAQFDVKQAIGKRYARMDEAGTPFCLTVDGQTSEDQTVTVRERDTGEQTRIGLDSVAGYLAERLG